MAQIFHHQVSGYHPSGKKHCEQEKPHQLASSVQFFAGQRICRAECDYDGDKRPHNRIDQSVFITGKNVPVAEYLLVCFQVEAFRPQPHVPLKYLHRVADGCDKHENQRIQNHYNADCGEAPKHNIERPVSCAQFLFAPFYCRHNPYLLLPTIRTGSYR